MAYLIALPIGWECESEGTGIGLRTLPLVAVASCGYLLVARNLTGGNPDAESRVVRGLLGGIGFIRSGAILKDGASVRGTAAAASRWNTGAIGVAVVFDHLEIAIIPGLDNFLTLRWLMPIKDGSRCRRRSGCVIVRMRPGKALGTGPWLKQSWGTIAL